MVFGFPVRMTLTTWQSFAMFYTTRVIRWSYYVRLVVWQGAFSLKTILTMDLQPMCGYV